MFFSCTRKSWLSMNSLLAASLASVTVPKALTTVSDYRKLSKGLQCFGHLVELKGIEKVEEFPVFLTILQFDVVLLEAMQRQLCVVVHVHLHWLC